MGGKADFAAALKEQFCGKYELVRRGLAVEQAKTPGCGRVWLREVPLNRFFMLLLAEVFA